MVAEKKAEFLHKWIENLPDELARQMTRVTKGDLS